MAGLSLLLFAFCIPAHAQQTKTIPRIGFLSSQSASRSATRAEAFRQGLRELGYAEGKNILIEYRWGNGVNDRLPDLAAELVRMKVEVIVTSGGNFTNEAARNATTLIPIVFTGGASMVTTGRVNSFSRPGGNITGVTNGNTELNGKRLELLKEADRKLSRFGYLFNPISFNVAEVLNELDLSSRALGLQIQRLEVRQANEIESAFELAARTSSGALLVAQTPPISSDLRKIIDLAAKTRLPAIYQDKSWPDSGGLMSYGSDISEVHRRAASLVDKILKGAKPAEIPVELPSKLEFVINLKAAKQIGLTIPESLLYRADRVIR
jgi:putative ABC transport system substrate-binding protein